MAEVMKQFSKKTNKFNAHNYESLSYCALMINLLWNWNWYQNCVFYLFEIAASYAPADWWKGYSILGIFF